jgi:hypothetical protein
MLHFNSVSLINKIFMSVDFTVNSIARFYFDKGIH